MSSTLVSLASSTGYYSAGVSVKIDLSGGAGGGAGSTVYTAPNGVIVTSSAPVYPSTPYYYMSYLFNNSITMGGSQASTYWLTSSSGNQTLTFDFGALGSPAISTIVVYPRTRDDASSNYRILVSDDNVTYTEVVPWVVNTYDETTPYGIRRTHVVNIQKRYVRFELTQNGSWGVTLSEIEFYTDGASDVVFELDRVAYTKGLQSALGAGFLPYVPYTATKDPYPVQYLLKIESDYLILAVQGIYQVDKTARTHVVYVGRISTPPGAPPAHAVATTLGSANLMATLSDNRRVNVQSLYSIGTSWNVPAVNIDNNIALFPIYVYRQDEGWRGWFNNLYMANMTPGCLLNGETVTGSDGSKYTFFNIPASGDGYYNNFLAGADTNKWLVIKH